MKNCLIIIGNIKNNHELDVLYNREYSYLNLFID